MEAPHRSADLSDYKIGICQSDQGDAPGAVGRERGPTISLPAVAFRSTALTTLGTAGIPPGEILKDAMNQVMTRAARGELRIETERVRLADIESVLQRQNRSGRRIVVIP